MRPLHIAIAATIFTVFALTMGAAKRQPTPFNRGTQGPRQLVIAELFTSEGCSSCPPADALLKRLSEEQPLAGVEVIALEEHVNYWNQLGWRDPFSSAQFSERQEQYAATLRNDGVYTPQLIIDGSAEVVGSRHREAEEAIQRAASLPKASLRLKEIGERKNGQTTFQFSSAPLPDALHPRKLELWVAVTERGLESDVLAGENSGHRLQHAAVVRSLHKLETHESTAQFSSQISVPLNGAWKRENLTVIAFLVDPTTHKIIGAARQ
jgi:hypothetical protein